MKQSLIESRIYPSVVTFEGDWRRETGQIDKLGLKAISLFVTSADFKERQEIFVHLAKTKLKTIPHVHIRHDMVEAEMDWLVNKYKTRAFSVHYQFLPRFKNSKHKNNFFVETNEHESRIKSAKAIRSVGGVCADVSHLDTYIHKDLNYYQYCLRLIKNFGVGCNHLSAASVNGIAPHIILKLSDLDYVTEIPKFCFSKYICLELGNSLKQQLEFKRYIASRLAKIW